MEVSGNASGSLNYIPTLVEKAKNIKEVDKKVEEESDEYVDDEFDVEEEEEEEKDSKRAGGKSRTDLPDITVSASASLLPPLGGTKT